jgi:hypothetical protein
MAGERQQQPRFDGAYVASDGRRLRFSEGGAVDFDGREGIWKVEDGDLWVSTERSQYEGTLNLDAAYLLGAVHDSPGDRIELMLRFEPHTSN